MSYPISSDDIRMMTLQHMTKMRNLPGNHGQALADCVLALYSPRVRFAGLGLMRMKYETDPCFLVFCRKLLDDKHPRIQLEAAISLAESSIAKDPGEPRLFDILLPVLEPKEKREASLSIAYYCFEQQLPVGTGPEAAWIARSIVPPEKALRSSVQLAMDRLERYLSSEQKKRLRQAEIDSQWEEL
jgi:hypothetical protein